MRAATRKWHKRASWFLNLMAKGRRAKERTVLGREQELPQEGFTEANEYAAKFCARPDKRRKFQRAVERIMVRR